MRFTAPSFVFECDEQRLIATELQAVQAYDVHVANLDSTLQRQQPLESPVEFGSLARAMKQSPDRCPGPSRADTSGDDCAFSPRIVRSRLPRGSTEDQLAHTVLSNTRSLQRGARGAK